MKKYLYNIRITKLYLDKEPRGLQLSYEHYEHLEKYWNSLGGKLHKLHYLFIGTDEIVIEFMLTYPYSQYVEITQLKDEYVENLRYNDKLDYTDTLP